MIKTIKTALIWTILEPIWTICVSFSFFKRYRFYWILWQYRYRFYGPMINWFFFINKNHTGHLPTSAGACLSKIRDKFKHSCVRSPLKELLTRYVGPKKSLLLKGYRSVLTSHLVPQKRGQQHDEKQHDKWGAIPRKDDFLNWNWIHSHIKTEFGENKPTRKYSKQLLTTLQKNSHQFLVSMISMVFFYAICLTPYCK